MIPNLGDLYLLVVAAQRYDDFEERIYNIVARAPMFQGWSAERRADLYALLVESIGKNDRISTVEDKVLAAYQKNAGRFNAG